MKSLFKRTFAAASGAALVLSQLVSVGANVNISAVDVSSSKALTIDKAFVLNVPIDDADPLKADQHSNWNNLLATEFLAVCDNGENTATVSIAKAKARALANLPENKYITSADWSDLLAAVSDQANVKVSDNGEFTVTVEIGDAGAAFGKLAENYFNTRNIDIKHDDGTPLIVDWTQFKTAGTYTVTGKIDFAKKTVSYQAAITADGTTYTEFSGFKNYATKKLQEAIEIVTAASVAEDSKYEGFDTRMAKCQAESIEKIGFAEAFANAVCSSTIPSYQGDDAEAAYTAFKDAKIAAIRNTAGVPSGLAGTVADMAQEKAPATVSGALSNGRVNDLIDIVVDAFNDKANGKVNVNLSTADINSILTNGYEYNISYPNGISAKGSFKIADDQNGDVLKAAQDAKVDVKNYKGIYDIVFTDGSVVTDFDQDLKLVGVESYKLVSASTLNDNTLSGTASYDVERKITKLIVEKPVVTTSDTTPTNTDTTTTTTTTYATYVSFEVDGLDDYGLIYWSEETADFGKDLKNLSVKMHFIVAGEDKTADVVDVTDAFKPEGNTPAELNFQLAKGVGIDHHPVKLQLTADGAAAIKKAITDKGYDTALIAQDGLVEGKVGGFFNVTLVLRGDTDLDGSVTAADAQQAMQYYITALAKNKISSIAGKSWLVNAKIENAMAYTPYSHYAMDTYDGNGIPTVDDAQMILNYTTRELARNLDANDPWGAANMIGHAVAPKEELHADPLVYETLVKTEFEAFIAANKAATEQ